MIHTVLTYIREILNQHFKNEFSISENMVVLSNIINPDGTTSQNVEGKIVFFLTSLDEETSLKNSPNRSIKPGNDGFTKKVVPLHLNMQLLFCANFTDRNYTEGLRYLSSLIRFFQGHKKISLPPPKDSNHTIDNITFELCKLDYGELSHLWSAIGSKLMPSIMYKAGILVFDDVSVTGMVPSIKEPES